MPQETTNNDILEAINNFSNDTEKRFDGIDKRFDGVEKRLTRIEAEMVTKEYLDDKLSDLRGDLTAKLKMENEKTMAAVG